jgi:tryptophan-rich sensory protein
MKPVRLIACIIGCELAGAIGSVFTIPAIATWYAALEKPFFTPPALVFAPVWTVLYALMGIALYLAWEKGLSREAGGLFALQLGLNVLWSVLFFGLKNPQWAGIEIVLLWLSILATILAFRKTSATAALLLVPYLAWTSLALLLNWAVWMLNA